MHLIKILRKKNNEHRCFGELYLIDNEIGKRFFCNTLEDPVRLDGIKIQGQTAIPAGKYKIIINWSNRFNRMMPLVVDVPNFDGIRIHAGNTEKDTEGCILVGCYDGGNYLINSKYMFEYIMIWLNKAIKESQNNVFIEIVNDFI